MEQNYEPSESNGRKTLWIIGGIILVVMIIALVYGATQQSLNNDQNIANTSSESAQAAIQGRDGDAATNGSDRMVMGSAETVELPVAVTGIEVVNLHSFPQKVQARVTYTLQGECAILDNPAISHSGKTFTITLASRAPKNIPCTKNPVPGDRVVDVPVAGLPAGKYTVKVGKSSKVFTLLADNQIQYSGDK